MSYYGSGDIEGIRNGMDRTDSRFRWSCSYFDFPARYIEGWKEGVVEIGTTNTKVLLFEHSWHSSGISCYRFTVVPSFVPRAMDVQIISPVDGSTVPWFPGRFL